MRVRHDVSLRPFNTFGIEAMAKRFATLSSLDDVRDLVRSGERFIVIGGGSNIVLAGDPGVIVAHMAILGRQRLPDWSDAKHLRLAAGESWDEAVAWSLAQGCPGLENLSAIPGSCGGAPVQNIGAYGVELSQRLETVEAFDRIADAFVRLSLADCGFGYRDSIFKREPDRFIVTAIELRLPAPWRAAIDYGDLARRFAGTAPTPAAVRAAVVDIRAAKLPDWRRTGNAGSFFKNPVVSREQLGRLLADHADLVHYPQADGSVKLAAAWLIDRAGWRGRACGRAAVHDAQALVLVNRGGATGAEVLELAERIRADVASKFSIGLEREPVVVGAVASLLRLPVS